MQFTFLATATLIFYGVNAQAPAAPPANAAATVGANAAAAKSAAAHGGKQPHIIPMNCTQAYLPFSEADVVALSTNDTKAAASGNYSTIPTEAACKGPSEKFDALCDLSSCVNYPVCNTCVEVTLTGPKDVKAGTKIIPQVSCTNNYLFRNSSNLIKNVCTDGNDKTYTCTGLCTSFTSCATCVSVNDPALLSPGP